MYWSGVARREARGDVFEHVSGERAAGSPLTGDSRFQAGSVSKTVLAIVALRLVERGMLDLHAPLDEHLRDLGSPIRGLTLHQLLSHTSGLGHWPDLPEVRMTDPPDGGRLLEMVLQRPRPHPAGSWRYSNFGYLLAAQVIARTTGRAYAECARQWVFDPAGMTRSTSAIFPLGEGDVAVGHHRRVRSAMSATPTSIPGGGDLWTTATDLVLLSRALHEGRLVEPTSRSAMMTPHARFAPTPLADARVVAGAYGYGTWLGTVRGESAAIHPGDNDGYRSLLAHVPRSDLHVAILTNDDGPSLARPLDLVLRV
jgi:CubicO group peptidase (beta-lactamase class C family)